MISNLLEFFLTTAALLGISFVIFKNRETLSVKLQQFQKYAFTQKQKIVALINLQGLLSSAVFEFEQRLQFTHYFPWSEYQSWLINHGDHRQYISDSFREFPIDEKLKSLITRYIQYCDNGGKVIDKYNEDFVNKQIDDNRHFFDAFPIEDINRQQLLAVVHDDDNNLVLSSAGSGKTETLILKIAYLVKCRSVRPEDIVVFAFDRKRKKDIDKALNEIFPNILFNVHTLQSFCSEIIQDVESMRPIIRFEESGIREFVQEVLHRLLEDADYSKSILTYFLSYFHPYVPQHDFKCAADYSTYLLSHGIATINKDAVESYELTEIANFFALYGIDYEYRPSASFLGHIDHKPSFYLTEHNIYIEHWDIDRKGRAPKWYPGDNPSELYFNTMAEVREAYKKESVNLIETFAYEKIEGILLDNLMIALEQKGLKLQQVGKDHILKNFSSHMASFGVLVTTFINLFKSGQYDIEKIRQKAKQNDVTGRSSIYLDLFYPIFIEYDTHLRSYACMDFHDMIAKAETYVRTGHYRSTFKYVLVEDIHDIFYDKLLLVRNLLNQIEDSKSFLIGDDLQSVMRFMGADVSLMRSLENHLGFTRTVLLDVTYRMNDMLTELSSEFIQKDPLCIKRNISSKRKAAETPLEIVYKGHDDMVPLLEILSHLNKEAGNKLKPCSVLILNRYITEKHQSFYKTLDFQYLQIEHMTLHASRGYAADFVIVDNVISGREGFPSEIKDDSILNLVLFAPEKIANSEERRLFYVALTRAKKKVYVITERDKESKFIKEIRH